LFQIIVVGCFGAANNIGMKNSAWKGEAFLVKQNHMLTVLQHVLLFLLKAGLLDQLKRKR
jgi:hypothetical protein